jgi:hypothetical protein
LRRWANRRNRKICFVISRVPLINGAMHFMTKLITFAQGDHERASGLRKIVSSLALEHLLLWLCVAVCVRDSGH